MNGGVVRKLIIVSEWVRIVAILQAKEWACNNFPVFRPDDWVCSCLKRRLLAFVLSDDGMEAGGTGQSGLELSNSGG